MNKLSWSQTFSTVTTCPPVEVAAAYKKGVITLANMIGPSPISNSVELYLR